MKFQLLALLFLAALSLASISPAAGQTETVDVLILGGGMAGISAAKALSDNGITNFIVLEAQSVIGGRVRSRELSPGVKIEEGANWIQGADPDQENMHPLFQLAADCEGRLEGIHSDYCSLTVYNATGVDISDDPVLRYDDYDNAKVAAVEMGNRREAEGDSDISVRDGLTMNGWTPVTPADEWVDWYNFDFCFAEPPDVVSLFSLPLPIVEAFGDPEKTGDYFVTDQRGFVSLVECLARDFRNDEERLKLDTRVSEIHVNDGCVCVTATTADGSREYCGKYAIVTFSIGVLQQSVTFNPPLPQSKRAVIDLFTMTNFLRIFLQFEETFWSREEEEYIGFVDGATRGYYSAFQPLNYFLPENASVLVFTVTGDEADRITEQSEEATVNEIREVLGTIYGREIPMPLNVIISDWASNDLFWGSFPSTPIGFSQAIVDELAAPVGRLYFAGEATSIHNTYVHGAYLSGIDAANNVTVALESSAREVVMDFALLALLLMTAAVLAA